MKLSNEQLAEEMGLLTTALTGDLRNNLVGTTKGLDVLSKAIVKYAEEQAERPVEAEINIDNTQNIKITGVSEIVTGVMAALEAQGFLTPEQLENISETVKKMLDEGIDKGIFSANISLGN